jgi:heme-degrading monooxygenase HmoA
MIVTIFRSRLREEHKDEYYKTADGMESLVASMPGFISFKTFRANDGERVSIVEFESKGAQEAWRNHPEHLDAQRLGREKFYSEFKIQVMDNPRSYTFKLD